MRALAWIIGFVSAFMALMLVASGGLVLDPLILIGASVLGLLCVVPLYFRIGERDVLDRLARGAVVILPLLLAALIPIFLVFAIVGGDIRLWQALLAGFVVVLGWLSTFMFQEERIAQDRRAKEVDLLLALRAEILNYMLKFRDDDYDKTLAAFEELKDNSDPVPLNFIATQAELVVFPNVLQQLTVVDDIALHWVVQFYTQVNDIAALAGDLRAHDFTYKNPREFQLRQLIHLVEMQQTAITLGRIAVEAIEGVVPEGRIDAIRAHSDSVKGRFRKSVSGGAQ